MLTLPPVIPATPVTAATPASTQARRRLCAAAALGLFGSAWSLAAPAADAAIRLAFVTHALADDPWWRAVQLGIQEAASDFELSVDYLPASDAQPTSVARSLAKLNPAQYQGLIHTIPDFGSVRDALEALRARKPFLPSMTVNQGSTVHSELLDALAHIGLPDYATAEQAGQRARNAGLKNFLCINHYSRIAGSHARCKGFAVGAGLSEAQTRVLSVEGSTAEMKQQILRFLEQTPDIQAWLALGGPSAEAALEALRALPKGQPKPWLASFDVTPAIANGLRSGEIRFTIDQQPYLQGYLPVALMAEHVRMPRMSWLALQLGVFANPKLTGRMSHYGLELHPSDKRHLAAGPGFVTSANIERIERLNGRMR